MPFLVARAPVRRGIIGSFRKKAPVLELPSIGRPLPDWNRSNGVFWRGWIVLMVRTKLRGTLGQRNLGGRLNSLIDGLGGMLVDGALVTKHLRLLPPRVRPRATGSVLRNSDGQFRWPAKSFVRLGIAKPPTTQATPRHARP